ncbi:hypothetical protein [Rhodoferax bucti]|uniref:hypothetical protein n=1 Tax=Rhodoferax bucti TaxID=2576305 RepID=UPI001107DEB4|nr:hypothetical protein [Rhodoferax bucti]
MLFEQLLIHPLQKIELIDPWPGDTPGVAGVSLLAGAMILHFDQTAMVCTSPLRYMRSQSGTTIAVPGTESMASLGYRLTLTPRDDADLMFPSCLHRRVIAPKEWMVSADPNAASVGHVLLLAEVEQKSQAAWSLRMQFLGGSYCLTWRPDLDGCIEFAPAGRQHTIDRIVVTSQDGAFGWLHPAYPHPFVLDESCWRSAQVSDWPWPLRKVLQSQHARETVYRDTMCRALAARFRQAPLLRQRLLALRYPTQIEGVPDGLILDVAAELHAIVNLGPNQSPSIWTAT